MAGMLPGVESARRRRIHNNYNGSQVSQPLTSRRPSYCLYATNHESLSKSSMRESPMSQKGLFDESMGVAAREAKKRLDERLQSKSRSQTNRFSKGVESSRCMENMISMESDSEAQVPKLTKNKSKRMKWFKIGWKSREQQECSICLDEFKSGEGETVIMELGCGHKFHSKCLMPWLDTNAHCPCCRNPIPS